MNHLDLTLDLLLKAALVEDLGNEDLTTLALIKRSIKARASTIARETLILSGSSAFERVFELLDPGIKITKLFPDGSRIDAGTCFLEVEGRLRAILSGERVALNLLQRLSGIATLTRKFVEAVKGFPVQLVDTRKTTPLWRSLEKKAVRDGGAKNHRFGLSDGILIKDNHVAAAGSITEAVQRAKRHAHHLVRIEIEVETLEQLKEAVSAGADAVLLDNMTPDEVKEAVRIAKGKSILEASGGINLENVKVYASTGVEIISLGALTHSAPAVDISLEISHVLSESER